MRRALSGLEDGKEITLAPLSTPKLHKDKPPNTQAHLDVVPTCGEPLLKASHCEFKAFDGCILTPFDESKAPTFNVVDLSPYLGDDHSVNLRENSSLEGEGDAHMGVLHQNTSSPHKQEFIALNQSSKAWSWLPKSPRAMVVTVVAPGWLRVFDPRNGNFDSS